MKGIETVIVSNRELKKDILGGKRQVTSGRTNMSSFCLQASRNKNVNIHDNVWDMGRKGRHETKSGIVDQQSCICQQNNETDAE